MPRFCATLCQACQAVLQWRFVHLSMTAQTPKTASQNTPSDDLDNAIAGAMIRLIAVVYDGMLILALLFLVGLGLSVVGTLLLLEVGTAQEHAQQLPLWYQNAILSPSFVLTLVGFYGLFWRKSGQTLGMQTWRLKTITSSGTLLTWGQSFVRIVCACAVPMVCGLVGALLYGSRAAILMSGAVGFLLNYVFCCVHPKGLAIHDWLSNTLTIKIPKVAHKGLLSAFAKNR